MNAHSPQLAVASASTRALLSTTIQRVAELSLEPGARPGSLLVLGSEGYHPAALLRESIQALEGWTLIIGVADERDRRTDGSFLGALGASLARSGVQLAARAAASAGAGEPQESGSALVQALAAVEGPVCVVVDNAEFVDYQSAEAIRFAMRHNGTQPLMLVMSAESLDDPGEQLLHGISQSRTERNTVVSLPPLTPADVQEIAIEQLGRPLVGRLARRFANDAEGNPALIGGLVDAYRHELDGVRHPAALDLDRGRLVPLLPRQQLAFDAASPGARAAAEIVAVLREPTALAAVNRIAAWLGLAATFGAFDLGEAERVGLVRLARGAGIPTVASPSRTAADRIAAGVAIERRREIHAAAADILTGASVLRHRIGAMSPEDTGLVADLVDGARTRAAVGDTEQAMSLALAAVQLAASGEEYERTLLFAGTLATRLHEHQRLFQLTGDIASLPRSPLRDAILADLEVLMGNRDGGIEHARAVAESPDGSPTARALSAHAASMIPLYDAINDHHELVSPHVAAARRALARAPRDPAEVEADLRWLVRPVEHELWLTAWELVAAARLRDPERLADRMARIDQLLRRIPESSAAVDALVYQARTFAYAGRVTDAANRLHRAIRVAPGFPGSWLRHMALTMHGHVLFLTGEWEKAVVTSRLALDSAFDDPYQASLPTAYAVAGLVPAARGEQARVERIERMLHLLPPSGGGTVPYDPDLPDLMQAELAAALDDPLAQLGATETARTATRRGTVWSWLPLHVDALARLGRITEATGLAEEALSGQTPWNRTPHAMTRLRARIALATGDTAAAAELYAGVAQSRTASSQPFSLARDRVDYAEALHAERDTDAARQQLGLAITTFRGLRANGYLQRAQERLDELSRPPKGTSKARAVSDATAADSDVLAELTARERQVAVAVAGGLTNREVAERLYVSVTTVNFHVRNILSKLQLSSRRELRSVLHEGDAGSSHRRRPTR